MGTLGSAQRGKAARAATAIGACLLLANCVSSGMGRVDPKYGVSSSPRVVNGGPIPRGGGTYRVGKPYTIGGKTYVPREDANYHEEGVASWYGDAFHGRLTANGEVFDMASLTAAHPTLPIPSYARVTNLNNGKSLIVRVNDRGPYHNDRLIDLSNKAAELLAFKGHGVARVRVEYVGRASLDGSDDRQLIATLRDGSPAPAPSSVRVASSHSFVPDMSTPARGSAVRAAEVTLPQSRPYALGSAQVDAAAPRAVSDAASGRIRSASADTAAYRSVSYQPSGNLAARPVPPSEVLSGRGLY